MNDERSNQLKSAPAWWWRDKDFLEQLGGLNVHQAAYHYELGVDTMYTRERVLPPATSHCQRF